MTDNLQARFQAAVTDRLKLLEPAIIPVLSQLVRHDYPTGVVAIDFQIFCDGFTQEFPVRAFFLDADNTEYFVNGPDGPEYPVPSSIDPGLLKIPKVYDEELEASFLAENGDLDVFTLAGEALVPWFAECWNVAGSAFFPLRASIALHDDDRAFDLVRGAWTSLLEG